MTTCGHLLTDVLQRVYVISLPERDDRRARLAARMERSGLFDLSGVEWVGAVDGGRCPPPDWFQAGGGAWGCLQSHLRVLQDAAMKGLETFLVLEDDVVFHKRAAFIARRFFAELPGDWGQLYLGGQHLLEPEEPAGRPAVWRCRNVNRTHAYAVHRRALDRMQRHLCHAPDYMARGAWHLDHQLGLAHERGDWKAYAPAWWLAGQDGGCSNVSGRVNRRMWWHPWRWTGGLPFVSAPAGPDPAAGAGMQRFVHFGNHLHPGTLQDVGLDRCVNSDQALRQWLEMIAHEALDLGKLPGIQHPAIALPKVAEAWRGGVLDGTEADLEALADYPFNGLFGHPLNLPGKAEPFSGNALKPSDSPVEPPPVP